MSMELNVTVGTGREAIVVLSTVTGPMAQRSMSRVLVPRAAKLSAVRRPEIASKAAIARWHKGPRKIAT